MIPSSPQFEGAAMLGSCNSSYSGITPLWHRTSKKEVKEFIAAEQEAVHDEKLALLPPPLPISLEEIVNPTPLLLEQFPIPRPYILRCPLPGTGVNELMEGARVEVATGGVAYPFSLSSQWKAEEINIINNNFARSMLDLTGSGKYMNLLEHSCPSESEQEVPSRDGFRNVHPDWKTRRRNSCSDSRRGRGSALFQNSLENDSEIRRKNDPEGNETCSTCTVKDAAICAIEFSQQLVQGEMAPKRELLLPSVVVTTKTPPRYAATHMKIRGEDNVRVRQTLGSWKAQGPPAARLFQQEKEKEEGDCNGQNPPCGSSALSSPFTCSSTSPLHQPSGTSPSLSYDASSSSSFSLGVMKRGVLLSSSEDSKAHYSGSLGSKSAASCLVEEAVANPSVDIPASFTKRTDTKYPLLEAATDSFTEMSVGEKEVLPNLPASSQHPGNENPCSRSESNLSSEEKVLHQSCGVLQPPPTSDESIDNNAKKTEVNGEAPESPDRSALSVTSAFAGETNRTLLIQGSGLEALFCLFSTTPPLSIPADQLWKLASQIAVDHQGVITPGKPNPFQRADKNIEFIVFLEQLLSSTCKNERAGLVFDDLGKEKVCRGGRARTRRSNSRSRNFSPSRTRIGTTGKQHQSDNVVKPERQVESSIEKDYLNICRGILAAACISHPAWMLSLGKLTSFPSRKEDREGKWREGVQNSAILAAKGKSNCGGCGSSTEVDLTMSSISISDITEKVISDIVTNVSLLVNLILRWTNTFSSFNDCSEIPPVLLSSLLHYDTAVRSFNNTTESSSNASVYQKVLLHFFELLRCYFHSLSLAVCCPTLRMFSETNLQRLEEVAYRVLFEVPFHFEKKGNYQLYSVYTTHTALNLYNAVWNHAEEQRHRLRQEFFARLPAEEDFLLERTYGVGSGSDIGGIVHQLSYDKHGKHNSVVWLDDEENDDAMHPEEKEETRWGEYEAARRSGRQKSREKMSFTSSTHEATATCAKVMPFSIAVLFAAQSCPSLGLTSSVKEKEELEQLSASQWLLLQCSQWFDTMVRELLCGSSSSSCSSFFLASPSSASGEGVVVLTTTQRRFRQRLMHYFLEDMATLVGTLQFPAADIICRTSILFLSKIIQCQCVDPTTVSSALLPVSRLLRDESRSDQAEKDKKKKEVSGAKHETKEKKEETQENELERKKGAKEVKTGYNQCTFGETNRKCPTYTMWNDIHLFPFAVDVIAGFLRIFVRQPYRFLFKSSSSSLRTLASKTAEELYLHSEDIFKKYGSLVSSSDGAVSETVSSLWVSIMLTKNQSQGASIGEELMRGLNKDARSSFNNVIVQVEKNEEKETLDREEKKEEKKHTDATTLMIRQLQGMLYVFLMSSMSPSLSQAPDLFKNQNSFGFPSLLSVDRQSAHRHCVGAILAYWCWLEESCSSTHFSAAAAASSPSSTSREPVGSLKEVFPMNWNAYQLKELLHVLPKDSPSFASSSCSSGSLCMSTPTEIIFSQQLIRRISVLISAQRVKGVLHESVRRSLVSLLLTSLRPREVNNTSLGNSFRVIGIRRSRISMPIGVEEENGEEEGMEEKALNDLQDEKNQRNNYFSLKCASSCAIADSNSRSHLLLEVRLSSTQMEGVKKAIKHLASLVWDFPYCMERVWTALRRYIQYGNVKLREASIPLLQTLFLLSLGGSPQPTVSLPVKKSYSKASLEMSRNVLSSLLHLLDDSNEGVVLSTLHAWDALLTNVSCSISMQQGGFGEDPIAFIESRLLSLLCGEQKNDVRVSSYGERGSSCREGGYAFRLAMFPVTTPYDERISQIFLKRWSITLWEEQQYFLEELSTHSSFSAIFVREIVTLVQAHAGGYPYEELSVFSPQHPLLRLLQLLWSFTVKNSRCGTTRGEKEEEKSSVETGKKKNEEERESGIRRGYLSSYSKGTRSKGEMENSSSDIWRSTMQELAKSLLEQYHSPTCSKENAALSLATLYLLSHVSTEILEPMMDVLLSHYVYPPVPRSSSYALSGNSTEELERSSFNYVFIGLILRQVLLSSRTANVHTLTFSLDKVAMLATSLFSRYAGPLQQKIIEVSCSVLVSLISCGPHGKLRSASASSCSASFPPASVLQRGQEVSGYSEEYLRHCYSLINGYFVHLHQLLPSLPKNKANMGYAQRLLFLLSEMLRSYRGWCDAGVVNTSLKGIWSSKKISLNLPSSANEENGGFSPPMLASSRGICANVYDLAEALENQLQPLNAYPAMYAMILRTFASLCMLSPYTFLYRCKTRILLALDVQSKQNAPSIRLQGLNLLRDFLVDEEERVEHAHEIGQYTALPLYSALYHCQHGGVEKPSSESQSSTETKEKNVLSSKISKTREGQESFLKNAALAFRRKGAESYRRSIKNKKKPSGRKLDQGTLKAVTGCHKDRQKVEGDVNANREVEEGGVEKTLGEGMGAPLSSRSFGRVGEDQNSGMATWLMDTCVDAVLWIATHDQGVPIRQLCAEILISTARGGLIPPIRYAHVLVLLANDPSSPLIQRWTKQCLRTHGSEWDREGMVNVVINAALQTVDFFANTQKGKESCNLVTAAFFQEENSTLLRSVWGTSFCDLIKKKSFYPLFTTLIRCFYDEERLHSWCVAHPLHSWCASVPSCKKGGTKGERLGASLPYSQLHPLTYLGHMTLAIMFLVSELLSQGNSSSWCIELLNHLLAQCFLGLDLEGQCVLKRLQHLSCSSIPVDSLHDMDEEKVEEEDTCGRTNRSAQHLFINPEEEEIKKRKEFSILCSEETPLQILYFKAFGVLFLTFIIKYAMKELSVVSPSFSYSALRNPPVYRGGGLSSISTESVATRSVHHSRHHSSIPLQGSEVKWRNNGWIEAICHTIEKLYPLIDELCRNLEENTTCKGGNNIETTQELVDQQTEKVLFSYGKQNAAAVSFLLFSLEKALFSVDESNMPSDSSLIIRAKGKGGEATRVGIPSENLLKKPLKSQKIREKVEKKKPRPTNPKAKNQKRRRYSSSSLTSSSSSLSETPTPDTDSVDAASETVVQHAPRTTTNPLKSPKGKQ